MDTLFLGLFDTDMTRTIGVDEFLLCVGCSLLIGIILAFGYMLHSRYSKSYIMTLSMLPAVVCVVIMMVNGNIGTGLAVAGAFTLVRFRSVPGSAKEITMLFLAMGTGLLTGMGYIGFGFVFAVVMSAVFTVYNHLDFGIQKNALRYKTIRIAIPEDLDYGHIFDDVWEAYTDKCELVRVKSFNMGSMFRITYNIKMKKGVSEKEMLDMIRCRNGNLEITLSKQDNSVEEL
ncbi:MAG: DUF4956 domain-containing protein [Agathobacter sp.]|nr:DUF4956 domain-containing protein [Agathobacter sp.]